ITSIAREHLEFFGNLEGVAKEEGCLAELLPSSGTLFINGDSPCIEEILRRTSAQVVKVGASTHNDWRLTDTRVSERGTDLFVTAPRAEFSGEYRIKFLGRHQALNAVFAIAIGSQFELRPEQVRLGLATCEPPKMRLQL